MFRLVKCPYCYEPLDHPKTGRPRLLCTSDACRRKHDRRKKLLRRREAAGVFRYVGAMPKGGRDTLVRRVARKIAAERFPTVTPTPDELAALEVVARAGGAGSDLYSLDGPKPRLPSRFGLTPEQRQALIDLAARASEARPKRQQLASDIIGSLPEAFVRPPGARKTGKSPGWINLPIPEERKLIDLPLPDERRP